MPCPAPLVCNASAPKPPGAVQWDCCGPSRAVRHRSLALCSLAPPCAVSPGPWVARVWPGGVHNHPQPQTVTTTGTQQAVGRRSRVNSTLARPQAKWEVYTDMRMFVETISFWGGHSGFYWCRLIRVHWVTREWAVKPFPFFYNQTKIHHNPPQTIRSNGHGPKPVWPVFLSPAAGGQLVGGRQQPMGWGQWARGRSKASHCPSFRDISGEAD